MENKKTKKCNHDLVEISRKLAKSGLINIKSKCNLCGDNFIKLEIPEINFDTKNGQTHFCPHCAKTGDFCERDDCEARPKKGWNLPPSTEWEYHPLTGEPYTIKARSKGVFSIWQTWVLILLIALLALSWGFAGESQSPQEYRRGRELQNEAIRKEIKTKDQTEWNKIDKERITLLEKLNKVNVKREAIELRVREKRKIIECNSKLWEFSNKFNTAKFNENEVCEKKAVKVSKQGGDEHQNKVVQYAYDISKGNMRFVYMLEAESGVRNIQSNVRDSNGKREPSFGYCQIHASYHKDIVHSPKFKDWKWQIDKCYELYQKGTVFYASMDRDLMSRAKQNIKIEEVKI